MFSGFTDRETFIQVPDSFFRDVLNRIDDLDELKVTLYALWRFEHISPVPGQTYDVNAGDDLIVRLTPEVKVKLHLNANTPGSIQVDFPGVTLPEDCTSCEVLLGEQDQDVAEMLLTAGGDLLVTSQADQWKSAADFDHGDWHIPPLPSIPPLPPDFSERINRRVEASLQRAQAHIDAATRRSDAKVQAAMRRAEAKARAAEVRARSWQGRVVLGILFPCVDRPDPSPVHPI